MRYKSAGAEVMGNSAGVTTQRVSCRDGDNLSQKTARVGSCVTNWDSRCDDVEQDGARRETAA